VSTLIGYVYQTNPRGMEWETRERRVMKYDAAEEVL
jgi:hypothetical protein